MSRFIPYADEHSVIRIGGLQVENRTDRVSITGDLVLTRDAAGLALAKHLQALIDQVVNTLESEAQLPEKVQIKLSPKVNNPF